MISSLLKRFKRMRFNAELKFSKQFMKIGNGHFFEQFKLILHRPTALKTYLTIGDNTVLNCQAVFETPAGEIIIGNNVFIGGSQLICRSKIVIEDYVFIAWGCTIYDHDSHSMDYRERQNDIHQQIDDLRNNRDFIESKNWSVVKSAPITICKNAWIGMNCLILKGVTIGEGAIVGAGSVVTRSVSPWTVVGGNPAKVIKEIPINLRPV